eukprot:PhM_4_TR9504/c1_g3_i1/m.41880
MSLNILDEHMSPKEIETKLSTLRTDVESLRAKLMNFNNSHRPRVDLQPEINATWRELYVKERQLSLIKVDIETLNFRLEESRLSNDVTMLHQTLLHAQLSAHKREVDLRNHVLSLDLPQPPPSAPLFATTAQNTQNVCAEQQQQQQQPLPSDCYQKQAIEQLRGAYVQPRMPFLYNNSFMNHNNNNNNKLFSPSSLTQMCGNREFWSHLVHATRNAASLIRSGAWDGSRILVARASHDNARVVHATPEFLSDFVLHWHQTFCKNFVTLHICGVYIRGFWACREFWPFVSSRYRTLLLGVESFHDDESYECVVRCETTAADISFVSHDRQELTFSHNLWSTIVTLWETEMCL